MRAESILLGCGGNLRLLLVMSFCSSLEFHHFFFIRHLHLPTIITHYISCKECVLHYLEILHDVRGDDMDKFNHLEKTVHNPTLLIL